MARDRCSWAQMERIHGILFNLILNSVASSELAVSNDNQNLPLSCSLLECWNVKACTRQKFFEMITFCPVWKRRSSSSVKLFQHLAHTCFCSRAILVCSLHSNHLTCTVDDFSRPPASLVQIVVLLRSTCVRGSLRWLWAL
jgi:hypothetical protein